MSRRDNFMEELFLLMKKHRVKLIASLTYQDDGGQTDVICFTSKDNRRGAFTISVDELKDEYERPSR